MLLPIVTLTFFTAFCLFMAIYLFLAKRRSSPRTALKRRLQKMAAPRDNEMPELRAAIAREANRAGKVLTGLPFTSKLPKKLEQAGIDVSASVCLLLTSTLAASLVVGIIVQTGSVALGALAAGATLLLAELLLRLKAERRSNKFTELFPDALSIIARSLRAGHSFPTAIQLVGQEVPSPLGPLFRTAYDQQQFGLRMIDALTRMNERIDSLDLRFFTTVISINNDIGGNLSELLDKLAVTIRERLRIRRQVRVYTAQGRLSGYVLGALPVVSFAIFGMLSPEYEITLIREPMGRYVLAFAAFMQLAGLLMIRKIIRIPI